MRVTRVWVAREWGYGFVSLGWKGGVGSSGVQRRDIDSSCSEHAPTLTLQPLAGKP